MAPENFPQYQQVKVTLHYEMYVGIPLLAKWISITSESKADIVVSAATIEVLSINAGSFCLEKFCLND